MHSGSRHTFTVDLSWKTKDTLRLDSATGSFVLRMYVTDLVPMLLSSEPSGGVPEW